MDGANVDATKELHEPNHGGDRGGASVWYRWRPAFSGPVRIDVNGYGFSEVFSVYTGTELATLERLVDGVSPPGIDGSTARFTARAGTDYLIAVDGQGGGDGPFELRWNAPPSNDDFANGRVVGGGAGSARASSENATKEPGEPLHAGQPAARSIWFRWRAAADGTATIDTLASEFDTRLAVYSGEAVAGLTTIAVNDDADDSRRSAVTFPAKEGVEYHIAVDGKAGTYGEVVLKWTLAAPPPPNDNWRDARPVAGDTGMLIGSNVGATREPGEPDHCGAPGSHSVWYRWTAPADGRAIFDNVGSDFNTSTAVFEGSALDQLTMLDCGNYVFPHEWSFVAWDAQAGRTYYVVVDGEGPASGRVVFNWELRRRVPTNDDFAGALPISGGWDWVEFETTNASKEPGEPNHAGDPGGRSVWYSWQAPESGTVNLETSQSEFDTTLGVYTGESVASLTAVASNDDAAEGDTTSALTFPAVAGRTYRIAIDGHGGASGPGRLVLDQIVPPPNDHFKDRRVVTGQRASATGTTEDATVEGGEPWHHGHEPTNSIWFEWTAEEDMAALVDAWGPSGSSVVAVYRGPSLGNLTPVASDDGSPGNGWSRVRFPAKARTTYYIAVDSLGTSSTGDVHLYVNPVRPANDDFANAQAISTPSGNLTWDNVNATRELDEPRHSEWGGSSVWYRWTAPEDGQAVFTTVASALDTVLAVYAGTALDRLTPVEENDDWGDSRGSRVTFQALAGVEYRILVDGQHPLDFGGFELLWDFTAAPDNDSFGSPRMLSGERGTIAQSNVGATLERGEPEHATVPGGRSVWFQWSAPVAGVATFTTHGSKIDTLLAAYAGTTVADLVRLAGNDDFANAYTSELSIHVDKGQTLRIAVDGLRRSSGEIVVTWMFEPDDTSPPAVRLTAPSEGAYLKGPIAFAAEANDDIAVARVEFLVDGVVVAEDETAPYTGTWTPSADGALNVAARATDSSEKSTTSPAHAVVADNAAPETTIDDGPAGTVTGTSATFSFSASEARATFDCSLDGSPWTACESPKAYPSLGVGSHEFLVRSTDRAGNVDATPAKRTWTIEATPPRPPSPPAPPPPSPPPAPPGPQPPAPPEGKTITGTAGRDILTGTAGPDVFYAGRGNDMIRGLGGNDIVYGGPGTDTVYGASGNDRLLGGRGRDALRGGAGADTFLARDRARDSLHGGPGRDRARRDARLDRVRAVERFF